MKEELLDFAQFHYNTSDTSHQFTPYELVFAYPARIPSSELVKKSELLPTYNGYLENLINNCLKRKTKTNNVKRKI